MLLKPFKNLQFAMAVLLSSTAVNAGEYIVTNAEITSIANTNGNGEIFTLWVKGGSGPCVNKTVNFPLTAAGSEKVFDRAYSTALAAYMSGKRVTIHNYKGSDCQNASYIRVVP